MRHLPLWASGLANGGRRRTSDVRPGAVVVFFWSPIRIALVLLVLLNLAACSTMERERGELRYGMELSPDGKPVHFPPSPDVPRYVYAGELIGERNFFYERPEKTFYEKAFEFLTGIGDQSGQELELFRPQAVATDSAGRIYATDAGLSGVFIFDPVLGEVRLLKRAFRDRPFQAPSGIAIAPDGMILVADAEAGFIARLDAMGGAKEPIGIGLLKRPTGVAYDKSQKRIFVADTEESTLKVFDLDGRLLMTIGNLGDGPGEFNRPTYLATWRNELYVTDTFNSRIQVFDLDSGQFIRTIGTRGTYVGQFAIPKGIALDSEGNLYVIESLFDHLLVFDRGGQLLLAIGGTGYTSGSFYLPAGLWVDQRDRVYVADMFNGRIVTYQYLASESESAGDSEEK